MEDFSFARLILQVVGYAVGAAGFLFVLSAVEPFREHRKAWLEFGKWLDVLPVQLRFMLQLSRNGLKNCKEVIAQQLVIPYIVNAPAEVEGTNFEIEELQEIRVGLLGWERSAAMFDSITQWISATIRLNYEIRRHHSMMSENAKSIASSQQQLYDLNEERHSLPEAGLKF